MDKSNETDTKIYIIIIMNLPSISSKYVKTNLAQHLVQTLTIKLFNMNRYFSKIKLIWQTLMLCTKCMDNMVYAINMKKTFIFTGLKRRDSF